MLKYGRSVDIYIKNRTEKIINRKTGKLKLVKNYLNNLLHGEYIYFWDNGEIRFRGNYEKSYRTGIWTNFDKNGNVILKENCNPIYLFPTRIKINYSYPEQQVYSEFSHN